MNRCSVIYSFFLACTFALALPGIVTPQDYEVTVTSVTVWVKAVDDHGNPVLHLKQEDFELLEDKKKVEVTCFEEVQIAPEEEVQTAEPADLRPAPHRFVLYLDLLNMSPREYQSILPSLQEFLNSPSVQSQEVMLAALLPEKRLGIIVPFTQDISRIQKVLPKARANALRDVQDTTWEKDLSSAMASNDEVIDSVRSGYQMANRIARQERENSEFTLKAVSSLSTYLEEKSSGEHFVLVYVSGGFSSDPGRRYYDTVNDVAQSNAPTSSEIFLESSLGEERHFDLRREIQKTIGSLNRMNVTLYTLDARGMSDLKDFQESLQEIAAETGGLSFANSQNFAKGLGQVISDLTHQYIVCYRPPDHSKKGEYHRIQVIPRKAGVQVRYREGYLD